MTLQNGKPVTQHNGQEPRSCEFPGCGTRLSRYNPNPCCGSHGGWLDADNRRNRDIL